jgi:hypothetical protein
MGTRVQVGDIQSGVPAITPTAAPVNVFVQPQPIAPNPAITELAQSLSQVSPALAQLGVQVQTKRDAVQLEADKVAGATAYFHTKKAWKDAVASGAIPAGASPAFQEAYQEMDLRQKGFDLQDQLVAAYHDQNIGQNTDPAAFQKFVSDGIDNYVKNNTQGYDDKAVAAILIPQTLQIQSALHAQYAQDRAQAIEQGFQDKAEQEVARIIDNGQAAHADPKAIGSQISSLLTSYVASGLDGKKANKLAVDSIVNYALQNNSLDALHAIDNISTGNGGQLGRTLYAREQVAQAHDQIVRTQLAYEERQQRLAEKAEREAAKHAIGNLFAAVIANPNGDYTQAAQALASAGYGSEAASILSFRESRLDSNVKVREESPMIAHIYAQIDQNPDKAEEIIMSHANMGDVTPNTVQDLHRYANDVVRRNSDVFQQSWFQQLKSPYVKAITGNEFDFSPEAQFKSAKFEQALHDDVAHWLAAHRDQNGGYDANELRQFMIKDMDGLVRVFNPELSGTNIPALPSTTTTPAPASSTNNAAPAWAQ